MSNAGATIMFTEEEIMHLTGAVDYIKERFMHEGLDLHSFGNPEILNRAQKKLDNTLMRIQRVKNK
jgi:hypothetical protein